MEGDIIPAHGPLESILSRYAEAPWGTRLFLFLRWRWTPYRRMAAYLPEQGKIMDGGSGHGLFSLTVALGSPHRTVEGVDHSPQRIALSRKAARGIANLSFRPGDMRKIKGKGFSGLAFVDVLHYLPHPAQDRLFQEAYGRLKRGGLLLVRDVDRRPGFASLWNRSHERLMTGLGLTKAGGLYFRTRQEWEQLARRNGFQVRSQALAQFPFADVLFLCRKP
jgi:SAM-dependent methyltransferase